ncbi:MAG: hypothetical protein QW487_04690 [Candidatus Bathyarchaeia archaeon]
MDLKMNENFLEDKLMAENEAKKKARKRRRCPYRKSSPLKY